MAFKSCLLATGGNVPMPPQKRLRMKNKGLMVKKSSDLERALENLHALAVKQNAPVVQFKQDPSKLNKNYVYSNEILTAAWLPRRLHRKDQTRFSRKYGDLTFITNSGHDHQDNPIGLPSGSIARKLFISLIDKAHRTQSPVVDFQSVYGLLKEVGLTIQTNNRRKVYEQFSRLSTCWIEIYWSPKNDLGEDHKKHFRYSGSIFDFAEMYEVYDKDQLLLMPNKVIFNELFFQTVIQRTSFGYLTELLRQTNSPLEIDILLWLVRRVAFTNDGVDIPLKRLKEQFANKGMPDYDFARWFTGPFGKVAELVGVKYKVDDGYLSLAPLTREQKKSAFRYNPIVREALKS